MSGREGLQAVYTMVSDPGHGWLAVPLPELDALGIADRITPYSYLDAGNGIAWLEEDCDLSTFARARWPEDTRENGYPGFRGAYRHTHVDRTHIRNLPSYTPAAARSPA